MTFLARNEADIVDAQLAFHLAAGVDYVIATDNRSEDGTTEILESYARAGHLHLIREQRDDMRLGEWVTRMARVAAKDYAADWVINADADEFYWPRGADLKEVLAAIPERYGYFYAFVRTFVLRPDDGADFAERMTVRLTPQAPINHPASPFRPGMKIVHRADPNITVADGTHAVAGTSFIPLRGWYPIELLHFPVRTAEQGERKYVTATSAWENDPSRSTPYYLTVAYDAYQQGKLQRHLDALLVDDAALAKGIAEGSLVIDTRLRDVLRALRLQPGGPTKLSLERPGIVDEVRYACDAAVLSEAEVVRLQRKLDELEVRVSALEQRTSRRFARRIAGLLARIAVKR
jgi:hypothetical protein